MKQITSLKIPLLILTTIFGGLIVLVVSTTHSEVGENWYFAIISGLVLSFLALAVLLVHYQSALAAAKRNLDEAQRMADIGSWERDIRTGKGYWSEHRYQMFGLAPRRQAPSLEEFYSLIHPEDREKMRNIVSQAIQEVKPYESQYRLAEDTEQRIFCTRGIVIANRRGEALSIVGTTQNITDKVSAQKAADDLLKQKDLFVRRLGHDMNTPLTPLVALLPMIRSRATDPKQQQWIDTCIANLQHIRSLVASAMQLAKRFSPASSGLNLTDFQLSAAVNDQLLTLRDTLEAHCLKVDNRISQDIIVNADRSDISEVIARVLDNVIRFTPEGSRVSIDAHADGGKITVAIQDTGIGLSPEESVQIFDEFFKADPSRHGLGSSGLGLSICRQILLNHGGHIWAESPGRDLGTTIRFTLNPGGSHGRG